MGVLFRLSDDQWAAVQPHLPSNRPGARRVDDRRVISGILQVRLRQRLHALALIGRQI